MNEIVSMVGGVAVVSSRDIAERFGKTHKHVREAVRNIECSEAFRESNFRPSSYTSPQNKKLECYEITRDGFSFLAMGFKGKKAAKWKEDYITAFNAMESGILETSTLMQQINKAIKTLEEDKAIASSCAQGLARWQKIKKEHAVEVDKLIRSAQLTLGFEK